MFSILLVKACFEFESFRWHRLVWGRYGKGETPYKNTKECGVDRKERI